MIGYWNYRLIVTAEEPEGGRDLTICETYYDDHGALMGYTDRALSVIDLRDGQPASVIFGEVKTVLAMMETALHRTILRVEDGQLVDTGEQL